MSTRTRLIRHGIFAILWSAILVRTVLQQGAWVPWAIGLALWLAAFADDVVRHRESRWVDAEAEKMDERLAVIRAMAGRTAFYVQSFLIAVAILWMSTGTGASPVQAGEILTNILLLGVASYVAVYLWLHYRV